MDDGVIGVVTDRNAELYRVNIGAAYVTNKTTRQSTLCL